MLGGEYFLVSCPVDLFTQVRVELFEGGPGVTAPADCPKSAASVEATLAYVGRQDLRAQVSIDNPIPRCKGMGSSSADVAAAIAAAGLAAGYKLPTSVVGKIALSLEPTDGLMFPGIVLFDHREGRIFEELGPPPPMEILALDFGGTVDTVEFNRIDRRDLWQSLTTDTDKALDLVRLGIWRGDPRLVGRGSTISARANQQVLPKAQLNQVAEFAESIGALGVNVAHSGTVIGVLLDARRKQGKSVLRLAESVFPHAQMMHLFRVIGGGLRPAFANVSSVFG
jgi:L-threonine kinase